MGKVTTAYLLTCAAIGVATGLLTIPATALSTAIYATVPPLAALTGGVWVVGFVIALRLIEQPGAAVLTGLISGLVATPLSATGPAIIITNVMFAAFVEIPFLVTVWRVWSRWLYYVGAVLITALYGAWSATAVDMQAFPAWVLWAYIGALCVSNLGGAWIGILIADRLRAAGVARLARRRPGVAVPVAPTPETSAS